MSWWVVEEEGEEVGIQEIAAILFVWKYNLH